MTTWPSVSVIVPSFNHGTYIERTLRSVLNQDYPGKVELIVSDGGSSDGTVNILRRYPQIRWWSEPDEGFVDAVTKGLHVATGEVIAIQSSDDFYLRDSFMTSIGELARESQLGLVAGWSVYLRPDRQTVTLKPLSSGWSTPRSILMDRMLRQECVFMRRWALDRVGGLRKEVDMCADADLFYRLLHHAIGKLIPRYTAVYQLHPQQRTQSTTVKWYEHLMKMVESCERDPFYAEKFTMDAYDKRNLYGRWQVEHLLRTGSTDEAMAEVARIHEVAGYSAQTRLKVSLMVLRCAHVSGAGKYRVLRRFGTLTLVAAEALRRSRLLLRQRPLVEWAGTG